MTMTLGKKMKTLSATRRKRVEARAEALIAEEMSIRELRRARKLTQARMAKALNIGQESVSRLEKRTDLHISTLRHYVEAMGGKLSLVAEFPDREPVVLRGSPAWMKNESLPIANASKWHPSHSRRNCRMKCGEIPPCIERRQGALALQAMALLLVADLLAQFFFERLSRSKVMLAGWKCFAVGVGDVVDQRAEGCGAGNGHRLFAARERPRRRGRPAGRWRWIRCSLRRRRAGRRKRCGVASRRLQRFGEQRGALM